MTSFTEALFDQRLVAILRAAAPSPLVEVALALVDGGVRCLEITLPSPGSLDAVRELTSKLGDEVSVGMGTVLDAAEVGRAAEAGATFVVSPDHNPEVVAAATELGLGALPGAFTPTEIVAAWRGRPTAVKVFPGSVVGPEFLVDCNQAALEGYESVKHESVRLGASLHVADVGFWRESTDIFAPIQAHEAAQLHAGHFDALDPAIRDRLAWGAGIRETDLSSLRNRRAGFCSRMDALFETCELLVLPASPVTELRAGADHSQTRQRLLRYTTPISLAGLPTVTIPAAAGADAGAVQAVGRQGSDAALLEWSARIGRARRLSTEKH